MAPLADQEGGDVGAVQNRSSTDRQPHPRTDEKPAEYSGQQLIGSNVWVMDSREAHREPSDSERASDCECSADETITQSDEWEVDRKYQERQRYSQYLRQQHRDAGNTPVDKTAGKQETMKPHAG